MLFQVVTCHPILVRRRFVRPSFAIVGAVICAALGCEVQPTYRDGVDARSVELGTSTTELVALLGTPSRVTDKARGDRTFRTFYYPNNLSCVVDLTTDVVCKVSVGETDGYCYPIR
jgi:hypothetical protein